MVQMEMTMSDSRFFDYQKQHNGQSLNHRLSQPGLIEACSKPAASLRGLLSFGNGNTRSGPVI
jgi:hypothetical protein